MVAELSHDPLWPRAGAWPSADEAHIARGGGGAGGHTGDGGAVDAFILGVPTHRTSLSPTGAHETPAAVRAALRRFSPTLIGPPAVDLNDVLTIADAGDVAEPDGADGEARVRERTAELREHGAMVIALGGDNSATYPVAQGAGASGLITFDAHYDLRDGISNGSPVRRLVEDGFDARRIVQVGIADFANSAAYTNRARDWGITVITLSELREQGIHVAMARALEIAAADSGTIHLDIDVDVCDRSAAPGCPASVPGGLAAWELRAMVRAAALDSRVGSADIVEVDATADTPDGRTVRLAALCVLELLSGLAMRP